MARSNISKLKVLVTRPIPEIGLNVLKEANYDLIINSTNRPLKPSELKHMAKNVDAILCFLTDTIDKDVIEAAGPNLKIISTYSTGYEHIDVIEAKKRNIKIGYTGNILTQTTADLAFGLVLCVGRRIVEADNLVKAGKWKYGWCPDLMVGTDVHGKTLGIIGMGKIGTEIARRALGFGMKIIYTNRTSIARPNLINLFPNFTDIKYSELSELASRSDYVIVCCSLNKDSYHLVDKEFISQMKKTAFLINIARGKIVNQKDLIAALKKKIITGAALDVYEEEPLSKNNQLLKMKNVVLLPHIGSASTETRNKMSERAALNIVNVLQGSDEKALLIN
ncbi:2-hydroxyacid dehydrogenase [Candidatus Nitrosocosmicus franklandus]|uniref:Glyoxylate reductase n=1 Tax=Candidatus Nitrosocosmicus franklandianus TaxID=1798806 RepID=A0A484IK59_9ARCH|nr:D-glycerate dehydrogenase [Candidatus Nitrosocosmicus franklandus]VFJ15289.1 Glyoxylate reductase [Candidatus Nitrosocosmicus franklandus]